MAHPISELNNPTLQDFNFDPGLINSVLTDKGLQDLKDQKGKVEELKAQISSSIGETAANKLQEGLQSRQLTIENPTPEVKNAVLPLVMMMNLDKELFSLPCISDPNSKSLNLNQQQILQFKFFKALALTAASTAKFLNGGNIEPLKFFASEFSKSSFRLVVEEKDLKYLDEWVKEIVDCQRLFQTFLPPSVCETGKSKGFSCTIKKNGELRGWLYGTMHNCTTKEMTNAGKLSESVYQRLKQCSVLGTEIKIFTESDKGSVENSLMAFARANAIVNLGLDSVERDRGQESPQKQAGGSILEHVSENALLSLIESKNISEENRQALQQYLTAKQNNVKMCDQLALLYQEGDYTKTKEAFEGIASGVKDSELPDVKIKRQTDLIQHTHACLLALEKARDPTAGIPKGFFAYGFAHLFCDKIYPQTMESGLQALGWEIEHENL
jgi:hypothetical protein